MELLERAPLPEAPDEVAPRDPPWLRGVAPKAEVPALPGFSKLPLVLRPLPVAVPVALPAEPAGAFDGKPVCAAAERLNTAAPIPNSIRVERVLCIVELRE